MGGVLIVDGILVPTRDHKVTEPDTGALTELGARVPHRPLEMFLARAARIDTMAVCLYALARKDGGVPEPILVSIAAALAAKSAISLYDLVKRKFAGRQEATAALETAEGATPDSPEVTTLATHLTAAEAEDPSFGVELRHTWQQVNVDRGGVVNQITGNVSGKVVQAHDIKGNITF